MVYRMPITTHAHLDDRGIAIGCRTTMHRKAAHAAGMVIIGHRSKYVGNKAGLKMVGIVIPTMPISTYSAGHGCRFHGRRFHATANKLSSSK